jgi:hypothetical protein
MRFFLSESHNKTRHARKNTGQFYFMGRFNTSDSFVTKLSKNSADLKPVSTALNKFKKRKNLCNYLPLVYIYQKNSTRLKL